MVIGMMVWFHGLDYSASLPASGIDEFPNLPPGPSIAALNPAYQDPEALWPGSPRCTRPWPQTQRWPSFALGTLMLQIK